MINKKIKLFPLSTVTDNINLILGDNNQIYIKDATFLTVEEVRIERHMDFNEQQKEFSKAISRMKARLTSGVDI